MGRTELHWHTKTGTKKGLFMPEEIMDQMHDTHIIGFCGDNDIASILDIERAQRYYGTEDKVALCGLDVWLSRSKKMALPYDDKEREDFLRTTLFIGCRRDYQIVMKLITIGNIETALKDNPGLGNAAYLREYLSDIKNEVSLWDIDQLNKGTGLKNSELFMHASNMESVEELVDLLAHDNYMVVEVAPHYYYMDLIDDYRYPSIKSESDLKLITENIINSARRYKLCHLTATSLPYYLNKQDDIIFSAKCHTSRERLGRYLTSKEMMEAFEYVNRDIVLEMLYLDSGILLSDLYHEMPLNTQFAKQYKRDRSENEKQNYAKIYNMCCESLFEMYGANPADTYITRMEKELETVRKSQSATQLLYTVTLVKQMNISVSNIMAIGLIGDLLITFLLGLSKINPIDNHIPNFFMFDNEQNSIKEYEIVIAEDRFEDVYATLIDIAGKKSVLKASCFGNENDERFYICDKSESIYNIIPLTVSKSGELISCFSDDEHKEMGNIFTLNICSSERLKKLDKIAELAGTETPGDIYDDESIIELLNQRGEHLEEAICDDSIFGANGKKFNELLNRFPVSSFDDIVRIFALSESKGDFYKKAYKGQNEPKLDELIVTKEDFYYYLTEHGLPDGMSYKYAECISKGEHQSNKRDFARNNVPELMQYGISDHFIRYTINRIESLPQKAMCLENTLIGIKFLWYMKNYQKEYDEVMYADRPFR